MVPATDRRSPPSQLRLHVRNILRRSHLLCLTAVAVYVATRYQGAEGIVATMLAAGYIAEVAPITWRRRFFCEFLFLGSGATTLVWALWLDDAGDWAARFTSSRAFGGWLRMLLAYYLLIPARFGMLRNLAALAATELLIVGHFRNGFWGPLVLVPGALICLLLDNWTGSMHNPISRHVLIGHTRTRFRLPTIVVLVALLSIAAIGFGTGMRYLAPSEANARGRARMPRAGEEVGMLPTDLVMDPRLSLFSQRDDSIVARLQLPAGTEPPLPCYLRLSTVPVCQPTEDHHLHWRQRVSALVNLGDSPDLHDGHPEVLGSLYRAPGFPNIVFAPFACRRVLLNQILRDPDGNLYQSDHGVTTERYQVDLGGAEYPHAPLPDAEQRVLTAVPAGVAAAMAERRLGELEQWRVFGARQAAAAITVWLGRRCRYDLTDLPVPVADEGGAILRFLFGSEADRRGHCQYFATAATLLLRLSGHAARPVIGFTSAERFADTIVFRANHGHAWLEVYDPTAAAWLRVDPTPPDYALARTGSVTPAVPELGTDPSRTDATGWTPASATTITCAIALPAIALLAILIAAFLLRQRFQPPGEERRRILIRRTEDLLRLAHDLGLRVDQHDTLSAIVDRISGRTGIDLGSELSAHLAARYGGGPVPPPWPCQRIRQTAAAQAEPAATISV